MTTTDATDDEDNADKDDDNEEGRQNDGGGGGRWRKAAAIVAATTLASGLTRSRLIEGFAIQSLVLDDCRRRYRCVATQRGREGGENADGTD